MKQLYKLICINSKYPMFIGTDEGLSEPGVFLLTEKETFLIEELKVLQIQYDKWCEDLNIGPNEAACTGLIPKEFIELTNKINVVFDQIEKFTKEYVEIAKGLY
jgi:hypothetical protein